MDIITIQNGPQGSQFFLLKHVSRIFNNWQGKDSL